VGEDRGVGYVVLAGGASCVVLTLDDDVPRVVHWGPRLEGGVEGIAALDDPPLALGTLDVIAPMSLVPERSRAWAAYGGLEVHRADGTGWSPRFTRTSSAHDGTAYSWRGTDDVAQVALEVHATLDEHGVLAIRAEVTHEGDGVLHVVGLAPVLPVPARANEAMTLSGRWVKELQEQRHPLGAGALVLENRTGRTGHETAPTIAVGTPAFSHERGEVWAAHLAWSGNHHVRTEQLADGRRLLSLAELLLPGEVRLEPTQSYATPTLLAAYSPAGLNGISDAFHEHVRARTSHPTRPRPVLLNTWEAVYMWHDLARLRALADAAAAAGVERFVLDDGWFRGRDDDTSSLGDWYVDTTKYPDGLAPLIAHVRGLGMEFGLWVEPEMVNVDSDLYRAHPDWALGVRGHEPVLGRNQLVLDLARAEVSAYLFERLDALLTDNDIAYLKWDMNRDLADAGRADGPYAGHAQTVALYALLAELRARHPHVEIESCASGGGRIDLGIAAYTQRFWASDCNDPLERQSIQRGFSYLFPPELMGAHVGGPWAHTTARSSTLPFRGGTAFFGHLGVEWNVADASPDERAQLRGVIEAHQRLRPLLHTGRVVRVDHPDTSAYVHGVVARDQGEALFSYAQLTSTATTIPLPVRLPGLAPERRYRVERLVLPGAQWDPGRRHPRWYDEGLEASGSLLGEVGVPMGIHVPEMATLVHVRALG